MIAREEKKCWGKEKGRVENERRGSSNVEHTRTQNFLIFCFALCCVWCYQQAKRLPTQTWWPFPSLTLIWLKEEIRLKWKKDECPLFILFWPAYHHFFCFALFTYHQLWRLREHHVRGRSPPPRSTNLLVFQCTKKTKFTTIIRQITWLIFFLSFKEVNFFSSFPTKQQNNKPKHA